MTTIAESSPRLSVLISRLRTLPPMPSGVTRLLSLDQSDPSYFDDATNIICADPALAAQVMKMANSALYAGEGEVERLDHALLRVGTREVVGSLTIAFLRKLFVPSHDGLTEVWTANLLSALACSEIANRAPEIEIVPETAFTYALLHHIGRLVMVAHFPEEMAEIATEWPNSLLVLPDRERETFGFSHEMAGRLLANRWRFPAPLTQVISAHHLPPEERQGFDQPVDRMIDLVNLGDCIADALNTQGAVTDDLRARVRQDLDREFLAEILARLQLTPDVVTDGLDHIVEGMRTQRRVLGI